MPSTGLDALTRLVFLSSAPRSFEIGLSWPFADSATEAQRSKLLFECWESIFLTLQCCALSDISLSLFLTTKFCRYKIKKKKFKIDF